jgi:hypothetical protein
MGGWVDSDLRHAKVSIPAASGDSRRIWRIRVARIGRGVLPIHRTSVRVHRMGLATLTHTRSPMGLLTKLLRRPENEKPFLLMPVGYPTPDARVPDLHRKPLDEIAVWFE